MTNFSTTLISLPGHYVSPAFPSIQTDVIVHHSSFYYTRFETDTTFGDERNLVVALYSTLLTTTFATLRQITSISKIFSR